MMLRATTNLQFWLLACDVFIGQMVLFRLLEHTIKILHNLGLGGQIHLVIEAVLEVV